MDKTNGKGQRWLSMLGALSGLFFLAGGLFGSGLGCQGTASGVCVARCDCEGCSQREREDCVDDVEDSARLADHDECGDAFSAYVDCYANEGVCTDGVWSSASCAHEASALRACSSRAALWVRSACQEAAGKLEACGLSVGNPSTCDSNQECVAYCTLSATCDDVLNPQAGSPFTNCANACNNSAGP